MTKKNLCGLTVEEIFRLIQAEGFSYDHATGSQHRRGLLK